MKKFLAMLLCALTLVFSAVPAMATTTVYTTTSPAKTVKSISVSLSRTSYTYSGTRKGPNVTVYATMGDGKKIDVTAKASVKYGTGTTSAIKVGTYTVTATYAGKTAKASWKIVKASTTVTKLTVQLSRTSYKYSGTRKGPTVTVYATINGKQVNVTSKATIKRGTGTTSAIKKGTYTVTATYGGKTAKATWKIV